MLTPFRPRRGITLIEVILLLILGVTLLGLFLVFLPRAHVNSQRLACMNNLRRLGDGIQHFHGTKQVAKLPGQPHGFLPVARIADGYGTWPVQIAPILDEGSPLKAWDLQQRFDKQPGEVREAVWPLLFCPARQRDSRLAGVDDLRGALGDYACVAGNGDARRLWTGPDANGPLILGQVVEEKDGLILRWRGRTNFADLEKRGLSVTFLLGDKHVPEGQYGEAAVGDGSIYDGAQPANFSRVGGLGFSLASGPGAPFNFNFGSNHTGVVQFLVADGSVRVCTIDMSPEVLGAMTTRAD